MVRGARFMAVLTTAGLLKSSAGSSLLNDKRVILGHVICSSGDEAADRGAVHQNVSLASSGDEKRVSQQQITSIEGQFSFVLPWVERGLSVTLSSCGTSLSHAFDIHSPSILRGVRLVVIGGPCCTISPPSSKDGHTPSTNYYYAVPLDDERQHAIDNGDEAASSFGTCLLLVVALFFAPLLFVARSPSTGSSSSGGGGGGGYKWWRSRSWLMAHEWVASLLRGEAASNTPPHKTVLLRFGHDGSLVSRREVSLLEPHLSLSSPRGGAGGGGSGVVARIISGAAPPPSQQQQQQQRHALVLEQLLASSS